ncbi:MAG: PAS domain-containing protein [Phycisphaeraceae bacterium]|nr:PAS domain-containing protein [Phycisphaeraceae bacterium]
MKPHIEFDRLTTTALIAMITLNAVSILPTFMMDHVPFPASLSLGVALVLVLRFDRRFAAYYAIVATVFALATWIGRGSSLAGSISVVAFLSIAILQGLALLATPWLLGSRRRDLVTASPSVGGVLRLLLLVIPFVSLVPAVAGLILAWGTGEPDPIPTAIAAAIQGLVGCCATAPFAIAMLRDESGRRSRTCGFERRWVVVAILTFITVIGLAHHPLVTSDHVLVQTLLALGSLSLLVFLAVLSGWMATAVGTFLLAFTTGAALVATAAPTASSLADPGLIATTGVWVSARMGFVLPVIAIALIVASMTEVHLRTCRRLEDREGRLGGLLDDAATGLIRTDVGGRILFANEAAIGVIGTDPLDRTEGRNEPLLASLIAPGSHRRLHRGLRAAGNGRRLQCELDVVVADGSSRIHLALFSPVRDPGEADSVLITMIDIDSRERRTRHRMRRDAERARESQETKELDRLTSLVMSDVNNLATALAGVASLARDDRSPTELDHMLVTLETGCESAARHAARLRHAIPGAAISTECIDVGGHLRDRLHRAVSMGRIHLDHMDVGHGLSAPVSGAFLDLIVEELIHDLESEHGSPCPTISVSVRPDWSTRSSAAVNIEVSSSRRRAARSIAALIDARSPDTPIDPAVLGLATIADRVREIGGSIDARDHDVFTIISIHVPASRRTGSRATPTEARALRNPVGFSRRA